MLFGNAASHCVGDTEWGRRAYYQIYQKARPCGLEQGVLAASDENMFNQRQRSQR